MVNRRLIQNQQMILKALGYYTGKCDGIWSALTIKAKKAFEADPKFKPAYPNNGMPFELGHVSKYPSGIYLDPRRKGYLACDELTQERITEWSGDLHEVYDNRRDTVHAPDAETTENPKTDAESENEIEESNSEPEDATAESSGEAQQEQSATPSTQFNQQFRKKKKKR